MTDPTPIAADPHVSGGVEMLLPCPFCGGEAKRVTLTEADGDDEGGDVIYCTGVCGASSHVEFGFKENLVSLWNTRLAATPVPANAEGVREATEELTALANLIERPPLDDVKLDQDVALRAARSIRAVLAALTTRPTDTAARESAVEAATVERCAKTIEKISERYDYSTTQGASQRQFALREAVDSIRAPTSVYNADAGEGDTAARDEGMVLVPGSTCDALIEKARQCDRLAEVSRVPACFEYRAKAVAYREIVSMLAAAPETTHDR